MGRRQAGGAGAGLLLAPSSAGLKIQRQAASVRGALFTQTVTISLLVSILRPVSAHHSCLFDSASRSFCCRVSPSSSSSSCSQGLPPPWSCQAQKGWRLDVKNCPEFDLFFVFERCDATQPSFLNCLCLFAFIFLFIPVFSTISLSVGSLHLPPPPRLCQPGCLASCPIPLKRKRRSR